MVASRWYSGWPYCSYARSRMRRVAGPLKLSCAASTVASSSNVSPAIALREAVPPVSNGLDLSVGPIAGDQPRHLGPAPAGHLSQVAPQQAAPPAALFLVLLLAQNLLHPAVNLLAMFAFAPAAFAALEKSLDLI